MKNYDNKLPACTKYQYLAETSLPFGVALCPLNTINTCFQYVLPVVALKMANFRLLRQGVSQAHAL